jgi:concentrative nucleoside transporter, CNT family
MSASLHSAFGACALLALAFAASEERTRVPWAMVGASLGLALALCVAIRLVPGVQSLLALLDDAVLALDAATGTATALVFGYLGGATPPFVESSAGSTFILAFRALPIVLVISALSALLFHWRVLPWIVGAFAWLLARVLRVGGVVGVSAAANTLVGMVEAPLFVRPYLHALSRGELFVVMTGGMATVAGTVMVLYAAVLSPVLPDALAHILAASVIATPVAIAVAAIMVPLAPAAAGDALPELVSEASSSADALTRGTLDGAALLINIIAMLIVFVALATLVNHLLGLLPEFAGAPLTLQRILGVLFAPVAWLIGIPWTEAATAGALLGTKTVLNELLAYLDLAALPAGALSERSRLLMTYALCGFANLGSAGIMIGGLATMLPQRRAEIAELGALSIVSGTLATCITAALVGIFVPAS